MKKFLIGFAVIAGFLISVLGITTPTSVFAEDCSKNPKAADCPCASNPDSAICKDLEKGDELATNTVPAIISVLMWGIGIVAVIMIIYGAIMMTYSAGNADRAKKGRTIVVGAVIGLVIALIAYAIVNFVFNNV